MSWFIFSQEMQHFAVSLWRRMLLVKECVAASSAGRLQEVLQLEIAVNNASHAIAASVQ